MKPHLIINDLQIEQNVITVGATNNQRWKWDTDDGMSGADAKTLVWVTLETKNGFTIETAGFFCPEGDPHRSLAMSKVEDLFKIVWEIKYDNLSQAAAKEKYFGKEIK